MRLYIFRIARSSSLSERVCQTDTWNLQPLASRICTYMCVSAKGTRQVVRRVWIDSRVLEVNGNRRGDRIFNMLSSYAFDILTTSTFFPPLSTLLPLSLPPLPCLSPPFFPPNVFAHPHNYSYRLIIVSPVYSRPPLKSLTGSARRFSLHLLHDWKCLVVSPSCL